MLRAISLIVVTAFAAAAHAQGDPKAEQLRNLFNANSQHVAALTWTTRSNVMGQQLETENSACAVRIGDGLVVVSNQLFGGGAAGLAGMMGGRGGAPVHEGFKLRVGEEPVEVAQTHEDAATNLRWYSAPGKGIDFAEDTEVSALGEEVFLLCIHDAALNYARFFRTARINAVVEAGKIYGLDGSITDCLGALVLTMDGKPLGIVGQKSAPSADAGIGRLLGGLSDPAKALGNRVLFTGSYFAESLQKARGSAPAPAVEPLFEGTLASATWREASRDVFVLADVKSGEVPAIGSKAIVLDAAGESLCELTITRHYSDPLAENAPVDQVGGEVGDPDQKLKLEKGMRVVVFPKPVYTSFRGIERFLKMDPEILKEVYGDKAKAGFQISQIPKAGSAFHKADINSGDIIIKVGETEITPEMDLPAFLTLLNESNGEVKLSVLRPGGKIHQRVVRE